MEEEEDWDAEPKSSPTKTIAPAASTASEPSNPSTYETLKITDGFKYSYEALASPANIDDWVDPPSYGGGGSRRPNGFRENNFKDSSKPFRNNRYENTSELKKKFYNIFLVFIVVNFKYFSKIF